MRKKFKESGKIDTGSILWLAKCSCAPGAGSAVLVLRPPVRGWSRPSDITPAALTAPHSGATKAETVAARQHRIRKALTDDPWREDSTISSTMVYVFCLLLHLIIYSFVGMYTYTPA